MKKVSQPIPEVPPKKKCPFLSGPMLLPAPAGLQTGPGPQVNLTVISGPCLKGECAFWHVDDFPGCLVIKVFNLAGVFLAKENAKSAS